MNRSYPKGYRENLEWRRELLARARKDLVYRAKLKELFHRDILFAFNAFFYTLDVRRRPEHHQPFCTYLYQDKVILELVECISEGRDIPLEKSRDMGVSWIVILIFLWFWLDPDGGADFLCGSRIEDYVDKKGDMRALIPKARYALYRLPGWLRPKGFKLKLHDNFMKLQNPETGASITGESNNPNFSTGGRYLAILFDEFAKWEGTDESAWTAAGDATPARIPVSTPFGAGGHYYTLISAAPRKLRLHWSLHPRKAEGAYCVWPLGGEDRKLVDEGRLSEEELEGFWRSPWYDRECERRSAREIAQELDIDYLGAGSPVFDGKAGKRLRSLRRVAREVAGWFELDLDAGFVLGEKAGELRKVGEPRDAEDLLVVWRGPDEKDTYVFGVDVVEGVEHGDYASVKVVNRRTKDVDASFYGKIDEVRLAQVVVVMAAYYTTYEAPWVGIETIGPGLATFDLCAEVWDLENLFMMPNYDSAKGTVAWGKGFRTNRSSRNKLVAGVVEWLLEGKGWADGRLCGELLTFVRSKTGKPEAKGGCHDDEVMGFGIALQVDIIAPEGEELVKEEVREDGLAVGLFDLRGAKDAEGPRTLEDFCLATVLEKKRESGLLAEEHFFYATG